MMTDTSFPVAALCCHAGSFYCLPQGKSRSIRLALNQLEDLRQLLPHDVVYLVHNPGMELQALSQHPVIDIEIENRRYWNGFSHQPHSPASLEREATPARIHQHLSTIIDDFEKVVDDSQCSQAIQRGQTALDLITVENQGLPVNVKRLKSFREGGRRQFHSLCQDEGFDTLFPLGELCPIQMRTFIDKHYKNAWPRDYYGVYRLDKDTLSDMGRTHGGLIAKVYNLFKLSRWQKNQIEVDENGRHHTNLLAYGTKTGRCKIQGRSIMGQPKLMRTSLLACEEHFVIEVDVSSQDIATAAGLSGDLDLINMYHSDDFYLTAARSVGVQVNESNKAKVRLTYKLVSLAVMYGIGPRSLAALLKCSIHDAEHQLRSFRALFPRFQEWLDATVFDAYRNQKIETASGWQMHVTEGTSDRSLMNWSIQATGVDVMNRSLRKALSIGLPVGALNHDALYVSTQSYEQALWAAEKLADCIKQAAQDIIPEIDLRTSASILTPDKASTYPNSLRELFACF